MKILFKEVDRELVQTYTSLEKQVFEVYDIVSLKPGKTPRSSDPYDYIGLIYKWGDYWRFTISMEKYQTSLIKKVNIPAFSSLGAVQGFLVIAFADYEDEDKNA